MSTQPTPLSKLPHFDPRAAQVVGDGAGLSPVPADRLTPQALRARFRSPPAWLPEVRAEHRFTDRAYTPAAVLVPIVALARPTVLLTQRTAHLSTHSGQIAFPGGKQDAEDADSAATALREAHEEIGLEARQVEVLGSLPTYTTGTGFVITPVVGLVQPTYAVTPNPHEVDAVFEVPLDFLMDPANHQRHAHVWEGLRREWLSMPYLDGAIERFVWGATAGMLRNLYIFLSA